MLHSNVISGNVGWGIEIDGSAVAVSNTVIHNSTIGLNADDNDAGNGLGGVRVVNGPGTSIGLPGDGNFIAGNAGPGIFITAASTAVSVSVYGNYIGTDSDGLIRPNDSDGIRIDGAVTVRVGGISTGARNVIAGNLGNGIFATNNPDLAPAVAIQGNLIGVHDDGTAMGNGGSGVAATDSAVLIGGVLNSLRNVISGNTVGVSLGGSGSQRNSEVMNNYIGTGPHRNGGARRTASASRSPARQGPR